jgi:hypothetical protein
MTYNILKASVVSATIMLSFSSYAATETGTSAVEILTPITITPDSDMNFGKVVKPDSASQTVIVSTAGDASGTATRIPGTATLAGTFSVEASQGQLAIVSISDNANVAGLALSEFKIDYNSATVLNNGDFTLATSGSELRVGATLTIESTVVEATHAPEYTVVVNYQ